MNGVEVAGEAAVATPQARGRVQLHRPRRRGARLAHHLRLRPAAGPSREEGRDLDPRHRVAHAQLGVQLELLPPLGLAVPLEGGHEGAGHPRVQRRALLDAAPDEARPYRGVPLAALARRGNVARELVTRLSGPHDPMTMAWLGDAEGLAKFLGTSPQRLDTRGPEGLTLLHHAARRGHLAVVRLLLDHHAALGLLTTALGSDPGGDSSLILAVRGGSIAVTELLLDRAAPADIERDTNRLVSAIAAHPQPLANDLWRCFVTRGHLSPLLRITNRPERIDAMKAVGEAEGLPHIPHAGTGLQLPERADELDILPHDALRAERDDPPRNEDQDHDRDVRLAACLGQGALLEARRLAQDARIARRGPADRDARRLADHNLGRVLARLSAFDDARAAYDRALDAWPDGAAALAASARGDQAARRDGDARVWEILATLLEHRGELALDRAQLADAARDFTAARPLRADSAPAYRGRPAALLALVETARCQWKTALELLASVALQRMRELGPTAPQTLAVQNNHAVLLDALGDRAAAAGVFEGQAVDLRADLAQQVLL